MDGTYCRNTSNETNCLGDHYSSTSLWIYAVCICNYKLLLRNRSNMKHYIIGITLLICVSIIIFEREVIGGRGRDIDMGVHPLL